MNYEIPLKRFTLHYTEKYISFNPLFWLDYAQKTVVYFRIGILIPLLIMLINSYTHFPNISNSNLSILINLLRLHLIIPLLIIAFLLSFLPRFRKIMLQTQVICGLIISAFLILVDFALVYIQPNLYFTFLLVAIIGLTVIFRIRFIGAFFYGIGTLIMYLGTAIHFRHFIPLENFILQMSLLLCSAACAIWLAHRQESSARKMYILNHLLENEKQKSKAAQIELERVTIRHTSEIITTNQQIYSKYNELLNSERQLQQAIVHDSLTSLPHRFLFMDRLKHATDVSKLNNMHLAVIILNIDHFRSINDAYGTNFGDRVLQEIACRLRSSIHKGNTISRLGGDEFGVIIEDMRDEEDALNAAEKIRFDIRQAFNIDDQTIYLTCCVGFAVYPFDGTNADLLYKNASMALEKAKALQINTIQRFITSMDNHTYERLTLGNQLRDALENNEYILEYQPQYHALTKQIIGLEALIRWKHPKLGLLPPSHFIPLAEEIGIISSIGEWVIRSVCEQMLSWQMAGCELVPVSVNVSGVQLKQKNFADDLNSILSECSINPALLELELTENIVFQNIDNNMQLLKQLRGLGVKLAIDDFGAGYSTLSHLARLPINTIKIDQLFAVNIMKNPHDAAIVSGIIAIAEKLKLNLIAEGIETHEQLSFYVNQGCFQIQGWYFNTSQTPENISQMLLSSVQAPA
jgi:diguanylate cyclase (GGDEF)-like protein